MDMELASVTMVTATQADLQPVVDLINKSYGVENGNTGVAFKTGDRIHKIPEFAALIDEGRVVKALMRDATGAAGDNIAPELVGVLVWEEAEDALFFGPLAVKVGMQGKGIGKVLMGELTRLALSKGKPKLRMCVVNHRTDVIPMYEAMGFAPTGVTEPFYEPSFLTRETHFVYYVKDIN